jgi:hypothetical protein
MLSALLHTQNCIGRDVFGEHCFQHAVSITDSFQTPVHKGSVMTISQEGSRFLETSQGDASVGIRRAEACLTVVLAAE